MVEINEETRTIKAKIVYYGPAVGGKTTNLKLLQEHAVQERRGMMISVNSTQERTIVFDLLPLRTIGFRGYDLRLQVIGVAGQSMYAPSRKSALKGADGLVFVANSAVDRWEENLQTYAEMTRGLVHNGLDITDIAFVVQFNKRDLPEATPVDVMQRGLNPRGVPSFPAVARTGEGVLETFGAVLAGTVGNIASRHPTLKLPTGLTPPAWAQVAVRGMFGKTAIVGTETAPSTVKPLRSNTKVIKIAPGKGPADRLDNRSPEAVAESYAEASAELGIAVAEMREERDQAELRVEEVQRTLEVARDLMDASSFQQGTMRVLSCLAEAAEATHATLLVYGPTGWDPRPLPPLKSDPLLEVAASARWLNEQAASTEPQLVEVVDPLIGTVLSSAKPSFSAVVVAPVRDPDRLFGLAMLYYAGDVALPSPKRVEHVGLLARIFSAPLELGHLRQHGAATQRLSYLTRSGHAAAAWSIAALSRGAVEPEPVDLKELLEPLSGLGLSLSLAGDLVPVSAHPDLLHLAVLSLVSAGETADPGSVSLAGVRDGAQICLRVEMPLQADPGDDDEAISALVHWIVTTCCGGRFETTASGTQQSHQMWLNPA